MCISYQGPQSIPQGLKPIDFIGFIGTTEVVPCYKTSSDGVFPQPVQARPFAALRALMGKYNWSTKPIEILRE